MKVLPVDHTNRLYAVYDLLEQSQVNYIRSLPWHTFAWKRGDQQENWPRRQIDSDHTEVRLVSSWIDSCLNDINQALNTQFATSFGQWWLDEPGFNCPSHTDGHLPNAMQIYWISPHNSDAYGTGFYHYKSAEPSYIRRQFYSSPNSGYLMLNHAEPDGSQFLQWHAMLNTVPANTWRLSSYWYFR